MIVFRANVATHLHLFSFLFLIFELFLDFQNQFMNVRKIVGRRHHVVFLIVRGPIGSEAFHREGTPSPSHRPTYNSLM